MAAVNQFDWTIDPQLQWPPSKRPTPPFGPTTVEVLQSCPLRTCFEASPGYERRLGFAARIGTAFHAAMQVLGFRVADAKALADAASLGKQAFIDALTEQEQIALSRPREARLPRDHSRVDRAIEAVIREAQRLWALSASKIGVLEQELHERSRGASHSENEVSVRSADGLFTGRIDRAERVEGGTRLVDYKSAVRADLPERYERQIQIYAYLWQEARGEWPVEGLVVYPLISQVHAVPVDPERCQRVVLDAAEEIARLYAASATTQLAKPGTVCQVCEFRPWCEPFWAFQEPRSAITSEVLERSRYGFQGQVRSVRSVDSHWFIELTWGNAVVRVVAPDERFPQLRSVETGMYLRVLDASLGGLRHAPQARLADYTEIYVLPRYYRPSLSSG